jgi:hypothetical protein
LFQECLTSPADYRWNLLPDGDGKMHLIDAKPNSLEIEPTFNAEIDTGFLLYTRINQITPQRITWDWNSIMNSNFNPSDPVRILIHGFNSGPTSGVNNASLRELMARGIFNIIV